MYNTGNVLGAKPPCFYKDVLYREVIPFSTGTHTERIAQIGNEMAQISRRSYKKVNTSDRCVSMQ